MGRDLGGVAGEGRLGMGYLALPSYSRPSPCGCRRRRRRRAKSSRVLCSACSCWTPTLLAFFSTLVLLAALLAPH